MPDSDRRLLFVVINELITILITSGYHEHIVDSTYFTYLLNPSQMMQAFVLTVVVVSSVRQ